jgi:hypothetical protein
MSDAHLDPHLQAEHHAPDRTTPQGTQAEGVEHGHEGQDVIFGPIFWWFGGLSIFMGLSLIILHVTMGMWTARDVRENQLPSPLFAEQREMPAPRILPNPIDSGLKPMENLQVYPESLPGERRREIEQAGRLGLADKTGQPQLPNAIVNHVIARYGTAGATRPGGAASTGGAATPNGEAVGEPMPSDASGGTRSEDRLR